MKKQTSKKEVCEGMNNMPFEYLSGFIKFLHKNRNVINLITYDDLEWGNDYSPVTMYKGEINRWIRKNNKVKFSDKKINILIQHDVDSIPEQSMKICRIESELNVKANIMIFNKRINRARYKNEGVIEYTDYFLDEPLLEKMSSNGFIVGYHTNALEQANYNMDLATEIFKEDINALTKKFGKIKFFSPHGGVPGENGCNNHSLRMGKVLQKELGIRWVHNKRSPSFYKAYSDGGFNNVKRDPISLDLKNFVKQLEAGKRYRVLLHPQYYGSPLNEQASNKTKTLIGVDWYENVISSYSKGSSYDEHNDPVWGGLKYDELKRKFIEC